MNLKAESRKLEGKKPKHTWTQRYKPFSFEDNIVLAKGFNRYYSM